MFRDNEYTLKLHPQFKETSKHSKKSLIETAERFLSAVDLEIEWGREHEIFLSEFYHPDAVFQTIYDIVPSPGSLLKMFTPRAQVSELSLKFWFPNSVLLTTDIPNAYGPFRLHRRYTGNPSEELDTFYTNLANGVADIMRRLSSQ